MAVARPMARLLLLLRAAALLPVAQAILLPVDVRSIICEGQRGSQTIRNVYAGQNSDRPYVLSVLRSTAAAVNLSVTVTDARQLPIYSANLTLMQVLASRRLDGPRQPEWSIEELGEGAGSGGELAGGAEQAPEALQDAHANCEEFFLSDGRTPVELPDTWAEARAAFRDMCQAEGPTDEECALAEEDAFKGFPRGAAAMDADAALCARLLEKISAMNLVEMGGEVVPLSELRAPDGSPYKLGRRLKGGRSVTRSGSPAVGSGYTSARTGGRSYGYSTSGMGAAYSGSAARTTSYGYSGMSSMRTGRTVAIAAGVGGGFLFWRMRGGGGGRYNSQDCSRNSQDCDAVLEEDLYRDDLMQSGFLPGEVMYPLRIVIGDISSPSFTQDMCPPANWSTSYGDAATTTPSRRLQDCGSAQVAECREQCMPCVFCAYRAQGASTCVDADNEPCDGACEACVANHGDCLTNEETVPWLYGEHMDVFLELTAMEEIYFEEGEEEESPVAGILGAIGGILFCLCVGCGLYALHRYARRATAEQARAAPRNPAVVLGQPVTGQHVAVTPGTPFTQSVGQPAGPPPNLWQAK